MKIIKTKQQMRFVGLALWLLSVTVFAQNTINKDKLKFNSFSITPLEVFLTDNDGGASITGELSYSYGKHIFTFSATVGETIAVFGRGDRFQQLNILYGRALKLKEWFFIDTNAGVGLFLYNNGNNRFSEIGIPLVAKFRFKTGDKFSIGIKLQANINRIDNIYSAGLLLQWNY
ncbi:hypothetical protein A9Q87_02170 [Flavobacteriales bacterium 34_180_T64]|nr:hypothetical protein A9Q87_02170 [Flavobacteriales bacterium 34_180_T64]